MLVRYSVMFTFLCEHFLRHNHTQTKIWKDNIKIVHKHSKPKTYVTNNVYIQSQL
jgi:hypothetical protein